MKLALNHKVIFRILYGQLRKNTPFQGESWLGLRELHKLTSNADYSLRIELKDFDGKSYHAVYDQFEVTGAELIKIMMMMTMMTMQVGPGDGYMLSVGQFDSSASTLGDSMSYHNGMKFTTK